MNQRYESADNRSKHVAMVNEQIKKRQKNEAEEEAIENFEMTKQPKTS